MRMKRGGELTCAPWRWLLLLPTAKCSGWWYKLDAGKLEQRNRSERAAGEHRTESRRVQEKDEEQWAVSRENQLEENEMRLQQKREFQPKCSNHTIAHSANNWVQLTPSNQLHPLFCSLFSLPSPSHSPSLLSLFSLWITSFLRAVGPASFSCAEAFQSLVIRLGVSCQRELPARNGRSKRVMLQTLRSQHKKGGSTVLCFVSFPLPAYLSIPSCTAQCARCSSPLCSHCT